MEVREGEGVPDFVLLEELTEQAVYDNIKIRYNKDLIYVRQGRYLESSGC